VIGLLLALPLGSCSGGKAGQVPAATQRATVAAVESSGETTSVERAPALSALCPLGHATIKLVPVYYGPILDPVKTQQSIDNLELVYGGVEAKPDSPKEVRACTTCRYEHDPVHDFWKRSGGNWKDFLVALEPLVSDLKMPRPRDLARGPLYEQYIKGENRWEYVTFRSREPWQNVATNIDAHILKFRLFDAITVREGLEKKIVITAKWKVYEVRAEVRAEEEGKETYARLEIVRGVVWDEGEIEKTLE
jgi:hypothetical protein